MRVAIVDGDVSYPATSGKRLRTLNLMLRLAPRHQIVYIGRCAPGSEEQRVAPDFLRSHGIEPVIVADPVPKKSGLAFYGRLARNMLSSLPYSVTSHQSPAMRDAVNRVAREQKIDLWQFEWTPYLDALDPSVAAPRLVIAHNVDTLIWQRYYENETRFLHRRFLKSQWKKFEAFEKRAFARANRVVAVSEEDAKLIRTQFGQPATDVVDNGIDREFFASVESAHDPHTILFLGALDWRPNLDAVELLVNRIFPEVRRQEPNAKLQIVGRNPPASLVARIAEANGVELQANVPDVRPFLGQAGVMTVRSASAAARGSRSLNRSPVACPSFPRRSEPRV
ncbi:MAG: glycosyltransferase [Gemmataceae bacterium]